MASSSLGADLSSQTGSLKAFTLAGRPRFAIITTPSFWSSNGPMVREALILAVVLPFGLGLFGCASREDIQAERVAQQAVTEAEDDAKCQAGAAPGSPAYEACRQALATQHSKKAVIDYQKRRSFDRVLGGLDDL